MPRTIRVTITDETIDKVLTYCRMTGRKPAEVFGAQDWSSVVNDCILGFADHKYDVEHGNGVYPSRAVAGAAAAKYWGYQTKWDAGLRLKFIEHGKEVEDCFLSPMPMPENWMRMKGGGFMFFADDCSQEEITRLVDEGVI